MTWLYVIAKAVFFPGTFLKGFWEHLCCRTLGVPIYAADAYISKNVLSGHVSMIPAETPGKSFFVCFLPALISFLIGFPAFATGVLTLGVLGVDVIDPMSGKFCPMFIVYILLYLFGAACLCNVFPYTQDALHIWHTHFSKDSTVGTARRILAFLPVCILTGGAYLERYSVTFLLSIGLLAYWIIT